VVKGLTHKGQNEAKVQGELVGGVGSQWVKDGWLLR